MGLGLVSQIKTEQSNAWSALLTGATAAATSSSSSPNAANSYHHQGYSSPYPEHPHLTAAAVSPTHH